MKTDTELLADYAHDGSQVAFTELVRRHVPLVYRAALRQLGEDAHLAEDVTQQVFCALAQKARTLSRDTVLAGWLYLTTHHVAANVRRAERRRDQREHEAFLMDANLSDAPSVAEWNRIRPVLDEVVLTLRPADREAILLRFFGGSPFAEIGRILRVSEGAARRRVDRALDQLRRALERRGIESTAAALTTVLTTQPVAAVPAGLAATAATTALASVAGMTAGAGGGLGFGALLCSPKILLPVASALAIATAVFLERKPDAAAALDGARASVENRAGRGPATVGLGTGRADARGGATERDGATSGASAQTRTAGPLETAGRGAGTGGVRRVAAIAGESPTPGGGQTTSAVTTFERLKSSDPATFAANLLAAGFSRDAVRGAVTALLREQQVPRIAELFAGMPPWLYWETEATLPPERLAEAVRLEHERERIMREIFPYERELLALTMQRSYGPLSVEKQERIVELESLFNQRRRVPSIRLAMMPWHVEELAQLEQEKRRELAALLTPAELADYDLRASPAARRLRLLPGFEPTEQEFRALVRLSVEAGTAATAAQTGSPAPVPRGAELAGRIKAALGEERYADFERASDYGYQQAYFIAERLELPRANAAAVYQVQRDTQRAAAEIRAGRGISLAQRVAQLSRLAADANGKVSALLTPAGLESYKLTGGAWLRWLVPSVETGRSATSSDQ